jgi:DNA end-binding protein Ku
MTALLEAKQSGGEVTQLPEAVDDGAAVVDLMSALRRSVERARGGSSSDEADEAPAEDAAPAKKAAAKKAPAKKAAAPAKKAAAPAKKAAEKPAAKKAAASADKPPAKRARRTA